MYYNIIILEASIMRSFCDWEALPSSLLTPIWPKPASASLLLAIPLQKRSLLLLHCEPAEFTSAKHYILATQAQWFCRISGSSCQKRRKGRWNRTPCPDSWTILYLNLQQYRNNTPHRDGFYVADLQEEVQAARGLVVGRDLFPLYAQCALNRSQVT